MRVAVPHLNRLLLITKLEHTWVVVRVNANPGSFVIMPATATGSFNATVP